MVRLTSITTRTGDKGKTGLGDGTRRLKHDQRIEAYGTVDEANSAIGVARAELVEKGLIDCLAHIQNDLFDLGADLCTPNQKSGGLTITGDAIDRLEEACLRLNENLPPLDSFILPAGDRAVAALHLARTITRRAERRICALQEEEDINPDLLRYVNRLSDLLFIMARYVAKGKEEKWIPQK